MPGYDYDAMTDVQRAQMQRRLQLLQDMQSGARSAASEGPRQFVQLNAAAPAGPIASPPGGWGGDDPTTPAGLVVKPGGWASTDGAAPISGSAGGSGSTQGTPRPVYSTAPLAGSSYPATFRRNQMMGSAFAPIDGLAGQTSSNQFREALIAKLTAPKFGAK